MSRWLMLAILVALWGSAFAFAKIAVATVAPEWTMAGRLTAGAFLLLPLALWAGVRFPRAGGEWGWLAALALVGNIAPFFAISWGQQYVPSALAGILIGFTGLVIVLGPRALTDLTAGGERLFGQFAILAGAFFFACNNVMARRAP
ncbi:MAG: DMT family transporter, partial [Nitratireductor sp.]